MNKNLIIVVSFLTSGLVYAGEEVDLLEPASPQGMVRIINVRGDVDIVGWDKDEIAIQGELDDLAEKLVFKVEENFTLIEVKLPKRNINWGDGSDLEINVPRGSRVDFEGVSTDLSIVDIQGGLRVKSVSGDVTADSIHDRIIINTVSGELRVKTSEGSLRASTVSGNLDVESHTGDVDLESVSGEIELSSDRADRLRAQNVSGEIDVEMNLMAGASVELGSVSGDVELEINGHVDAQFEIDAGMGGEIYNEISDDAPSSSFPGGEKLRMTIGNGSARITIRTVSGDIRLEK